MARAEVARTKSTAKERLKAIRIASEVEGKEGVKVQGAEVESRSRKRSGRGIYIPHGVVPYRLGYSVSAISRVRRQAHSLPHIGLVVFDILGNQCSTHHPAFETCCAAWSAPCVIFQFVKVGFGVSLQSSDEINPL